MKFNLKVSSPQRAIHAPYQPWRDDWQAIAMAFALVISAGVLGGCGVIPPNVLTTPGNSVPVGEVFPSALVAEPIWIRAGYTHTTQPFQIKGPKERWAVAPGFVRGGVAQTAQQKIVRNSDICWINSSKRNLRPENCNNVTPGFNLRWELLRGDGGVATQFEFDSLRDESGGTYSEAATTRTLSGFSDQSPGQYRLRITVLRDAKELDFLKPHILVNRPFFSSRSIE